MNFSCIVKVGGSLFDLPDLRQRLQRFLGELAAERVLIVPGGGATADVVRLLDRVHRLGEETAHWLALQTLSVNARFLAELLACPLFPSDSLAGAASSELRLYVLDPAPFFRADEASLGHFPHCWDVTSDSLAVRAAALVGARELMLLKSAPWDRDDWQKAVQARLVDAYFPTALASVPAFCVRVVNLRDLAWA